MNFSFTGSVCYHLDPLVHEHLIHGNAFQKHVLGRVYGVVVCAPLYAITAALDLILGVGAALVSIGLWGLSLLSSRIDPSSVRFFADGLINFSHRGVDWCIRSLFSVLNPNALCSEKYWDGYPIRPEDKFLVPRPQGTRPSDGILTPCLQDPLHTRAHGLHCDNASNFFLREVVSRALIVSAYLLSTITRVIDLALGVIGFVLGILTFGQVEYFIFLAVKGFQIHRLVTDVFIEH